MSRLVREKRMLVNRNRVLIGTLLLVAALGVSAFIIPRYIAGKQAVYPVITVTRSLPPGSILYDSDISVSKTSDKHLADTACSDPDEVVGKITVRQLYAGEYLLPIDVSEDYTAPTIYNTLPEGHLIISISTQSLASSVAGQIRANDIIRIYSLDEEGSAKTPCELQYVKVLAVYDSSGTELNGYSTGINRINSPVSESGSSNGFSISNPTGGLTDTSKEEEQPTPAFISLLVTETQALKLVELERRGAHYISLVSRDNKELESKYLEMQAANLEGYRKE
jgi:Flp pilus assembly protein CpaB